MCTLLAVWSIVAWLIAREMGNSLAPEVSVRTDTANAAAYQQVVVAIGKMYACQGGRIAKAECGLVNKIEGVKELRPGTHTVYDTIIDSVKTPVFVHVGIRDGKEIVLHYLVPDSGGFRPVRDSAIAFSNCDERLDFYEGKARCDPARLGHIGGFVEVGASVSATARLPPAVGAPEFAARIGLQWRPSYRSASGATLFLDERRRVGILARKGVWF